MPVESKHHKKLLKEIKQLAEKDPFDTEQRADYAGHKDKTYSLSNPQLRKIAKSWAEKNKSIELEEYINLLNSIYQKGETSTEKYLAGYLLEYMPKLRKELNPRLLDKWLENLTGWAQVDSLCQSKFSSNDLFNQWDKWKNLLSSLNKSANINKRRASLVLLTKPVRDSKDEKFTKLAFENIDSLKTEKDKLITKAISWLLREMVKLHSKKVKNYLEENKQNLPAIAVRETTRKLQTGKK